MDQRRPASKPGWPSFGQVRAGKGNIKWDPGERDIPAPGLSTKETKQRHHQPTTEQPAQINGPSHQVLLLNPAYN